MSEIKLKDEQLEKVNGGSNFEETISSSNLSVILFYFILVVLKIQAGMYQQ